MRHIIEILRLKHEHHLPIRQIARSCGVASSTVGDYLRRAEAAQLGWPLPQGMGEAELEARLAAVATPRVAGVPAPPIPDWGHIHAELRRPNVTLRLLWQEYLRTDPAGLKYSRFCERYQLWRKTLEPTLRQVHVPGEKLFVDWAGQTVPIRSGADGTLQPASVFVAALGASGKIFAAAFPDQKLASWISAHVRAYEFYGGVTTLTVPDNTRTAVVEPCRYEPLLHRTYQEMAEHYGTVILPTRIRKPRDKARAESAVQIAQYQILAAVRDQEFFSVAELNRAIESRLPQINARPFQKLDGSRDQWFATLDQPRLRPLPSAAFVLATWLEATVNIDYHVVVDHHYYSVPYGLIRHRLQVRLTDASVEFFHKATRVAAHPRSFLRGQFTTLAEHRPKSHQRHLEWTPGRIVEWARKIGPQCAGVVEQVMRSRPHPEQGFRSCLGIIRLARAHGEARLEAACQRALHFGTVSYRSIESILDQRLDSQPLDVDLPWSPPAHENVRGQEYFA